MSSLEGKGLLGLFWELAEASPKQRTHAACRLVRYLLQTSKAGDGDEQSGEPERNGEQQLPGITVVDSQKLHCMLTAPEGRCGVPYDLQYAINRLFQGLASPRPCTRQSYALTLLLLLQQLQQQNSAVTLVNLSAFAQNLRRAFAMKQAAPSEVKQLHLARCLGVYILLSLGFFRKKQCLPEVQEVLEMLWEAFHGKLQLQEASGLLIRQVLRQLAEMGEGAVGLEACKRRLRGVATAQLVTREDTADKAKAGDVGKTATGRLPCSLLDVYVQLQADMQQKLMPDVEWLHTDLFTAQNLPSLVGFLSDTAAAHPRLHGLWGGVMRLVLLRRDADEVFQRLWAAVDSQLFPSKARGSRDSDTGAKRPQDQSLQSAFIGFRAALLVLHIIKQRLLLRETQRDARLTHDQLQRMASIVFTEGRGFLRVFIVHLESPRSPLHPVARFIAERLEEVFSGEGQLGAAQAHPLCVSPSSDKNGERRFVRAHQLPSLCCLSCGCQVDPYVHGLLEPLLGEATDEAEHFRPFGVDFKALSEPLQLHPERRVAMLLSFGAACRFQSLKRQTLWRLCSICFSSATAEEAERLDMCLFTALNEADAGTSVSREEQQTVVGRKAMWLLDSLLTLPQLLGSKVTEGCSVFLPDWLLSAILCSSSFAVSVSASKKALSGTPPVLAAAVDPSDLGEASEATPPDGTKDVAIPLRSVQLPQLFLIAIGNSAVNGTKHGGSKEPFTASAARSRIQGKICHLLGSSCTAAMEGCTRAEGDAASDYAEKLHRAHAQLFQLIEREAAAGKKGLHLQARAISDAGRGYKANVLLVSNDDVFSAIVEEKEEKGKLLAFCYFASSQGAGLAAAAGAALNNGKKLHAGFVAAAQVVGIALCALSLMPYLLCGGGDGSATSMHAPGGENGKAEADGIDQELAFSEAAGSAARAFAAADTQTAEAARQEEYEETLEASLHALRQMLQVGKPLYLYLQQCDQERQEAAVSAQAKIAAISSSLLLFGGNSSASGLLREVASGLWRSFSCFAPSGSVTKLLAVATSISNSQGADEEDSEEEQGEDEAVTEREDSSSDESEGDEEEEEDADSVSKLPNLPVGSSTSNRDSDDDDAASSSDESKADPFAVQLSADAALKALADDTALPDAYCPPGGFKQQRVSQRKLLLRQRRRLGELRLRALAALQVYIDCNSRNLLALHVLASLYAAFSRVSVQAAQSRQRRQKLPVYDDLAKKIRRTIELALKGTAQAWQNNTTANPAGSSGDNKLHRRVSSITLCYQALQEQHLQALLQKAGASSQKQLKRKRQGVGEQLPFPPLMPALEGGDRMQLLLEGKSKSSLLCLDSTADVGANLEAGEPTRLFLAQILWTLLAEEMISVLQVCSRKLPSQLATQNQVLGVEMLMRLSKLEQQVYAYCDATSKQPSAGTAAICNQGTILAQLLSVALAARSRLRRCHLGEGFFQTLAERRPEVFRFCDVYGTALSSRSPFVRRELAQVAFRVYRHPGIAPPVGAAQRPESNFHVIQKTLSTAFVLTRLLSKGRSGKRGSEQIQPGTSDCEPRLIPRKALRSPAEFAVFVIYRLVELIKETSEAEVRPRQEQPTGNEQTQKKGRERHQQRAPRAEIEEDEERKCLFSSIAQRQAAVTELLKQLQQLLQVFARRDQHMNAVENGAVEKKGFKVKLQAIQPSIEPAVQEAAIAVGGKKPSSLANAVSALLSRITGANQGDEMPRQEKESNSAMRKRKNSGDASHNKGDMPRKKRKEKGAHEGKGSG